MSDLIVVAFDSEEKANAVRTKFMQMSKEYLIGLEDAVVAVKKEDGKVKLQQMLNLTTGGAISGGFWGALIGLIFLNPLLGAAVGAAGGAAGGALADVGISDQFMKDLAATFQPGSSLLFIQYNKMTPDKVIDELRGEGGKVIKTSLSHDDEAKLQAALSGAAAAAAAPAAPATPPALPKA